MELVGNTATGAMIYETEDKGNRYHIHTSQKSLAEKCLNIVLNIIFQLKI